MLEYKGVKIYWLGHSSFKLKDGLTIYIDPFRLEGGELADLVLVTHEHFDHFSPEDIRKVSDRHTVLVMPKECMGKLKGMEFEEVRYVLPGDKVSVRGVEIEAVPAYNVNKFRSPGVVFHPKEDGKVGYILTFKGVRIYHMGDTDFIPEMKGLKVDVALVPVSGTYVMTPEEAAEAVKEIKPELAIPMHYGSIVGSEEDAERFAELAGLRVEILKRSDP